MQSHHADSAQRLSRGENAQPHHRIRAPDRDLLPAQPLRDLPRPGDLPVLAGEVRRLRGLELSVCEGPPAQGL